MSFLKDSPDPFFSNWTIIRDSPAYEEILHIIKVSTNLSPSKLSEAASTLMTKIGESVTSSRKLRGIIRKIMGENIETLSIIRVYNVYQHM